MNTFPLPHAALPGDSGFGRVDTDRRFHNCAPDRCVQGNHAAIAGTDKHFAFQTATPRLVRATAEFLITLSRTSRVEISTVPCLKSRRLQYPIQGSET